MYRLIGKRILDTVLSAIGLIICCIPMGIIALLIHFDSEGPVLFKQERLGKNQKVFTVYKFRTMCNHAYEMGGVATRSDDARITKVGNILRRTSLDELLDLDQYYLLSLKNINQIKDIHVDMMHCQVCFVQ